MPSQMKTLDERIILAEAAARGQLTMQLCLSCERWVWFPRVACPHCFSRVLEWRAASGEGTVITASVVHRTHHEDYEPYVPIVLALIFLDEGCEMVSSLVGENRTGVQTGDRVRVTSSGRWSRLPQFEIVDRA